MVKVGIIGAGISGLASAYFLMKMVPGVTVKVFERGEHVGGWIKTQGGDSPYEKGPRSFRATNRRVFDLLKIVGIVHYGRIVFSRHSSPSARNRFIYAGGRLCLLPKGFLSFFRTSPPFSSPLVRHVINDIFSPEIDGEVTVDHFFRSRFGDEVSDFLVSAVCRGIFASSSRTLSMRSCFPDLHGSAVRGRGSLLRGMLQDALVGRRESGHSPSGERCVREKWAAFSFEGGLQELPRRMLAFLSQLGVTFSLGCDVRSVEFGEGGAVLGGEKFDHIISAIYCFDLAKLVGREFAALLQAIRGIDLTVVDLELRGRPLPIDGFGYLVPECESDQLYGVTFNSRIFPRAGAPDQLSFFFNGNISDYEDKTLSYLRSHLQIRDDPAWMCVNVNRNCLPEYSLGHSLRIDRITEHIAERGWPLTMVGGSLHHVDVPSIVSDAKTAVQALVAKMFNV